MTATTTETLCEAHGPAIKYNSTKKDSTRHAGPELAKDLAVHNRAGQNMKCY